MLYNTPFVENIFSPIKKIATFSASSSFLLQDYLSKKENCLFKTSSSFEFPSYLSFETEKELASKKINP